MFKKLKYAWALYRTLQAQGKVPFSTKSIVIIVLVYLLLPIDFIPDFTPLLGYIDDGILLATGLHYAWKWLNRNATEADRAKAAAVDVTPQ